VHKTTSKLEARAWGFNFLELNRIEAMVMLENLASMKLLNKLGFSEEGILKEYGFWKGKFHDLRIFSLLKKDYK
ncbi:MAG: GNAT family N-acetyltransferase, partial [Hydrococcus sp. CRU_1_1]|nr:GNAT family N-acetyltransferase [Hydrococcus sp. CRU_1_1]